MSEYPIPVAVSLVYQRPMNVILLGRRMNKEEYGLFGFPGGKQKPGEKVEDCLIRELKEETDLQALQYSFLGYVDVPIHEHFLALLFFVDSFAGNVRNMEPNKCMGWDWYKLNNLPPQDQWTRTMALTIKAGYFQRILSCH